MSEPCCCRCDAEFEEGEIPVDEYDPILGVHFLVHSYCHEEAEEAALEEEAAELEAARERWEDLEVDRAIEARLFGEG